MEQLMIKLLFEGKTQQEIAEWLRQNGIRPNALSTVEKAIKRIKTQNGAKTMFHLGAILSKRTSG